MIKMKKILLTGILLTTLLSSFAQAQTNTELKNLINQSFGYFPKIKEVQSAVTTAEQRVDLSKTNLPDIFANGSYNYVRPKIEIPFPIGPGGALENFQFAPVNNVGAALNANYLLFDFGRIKANVEKSKTELQFAKHNVEYVQNQLAYQVANIYYNIVYFQKAISIQDTVLAYLDENKRIIDSKLKNGDAIKIDLLNIQTQIDAEQNTKVDLQNSLQKQINLLAYTTGNTQTNGTSFDFDYAFKQSGDALNEAQANNIDFVLAKDKIKQAQSDVAITKITDRPSVNVQANTGFKNGYVPSVNDVKFNYAAGVSLVVPIYSGGRTKRQINIAESVVKQNELAVETLSSEYKKNIEQALTDVQTDMERIKNTAGQIEEAKSAEVLAASRFKNGVGTNLEITNASTNTQRALLSRLQYEYQLCIAKVQLAQLTGYKYW
jgi:outer membrane protein